MRWGVFLLLLARIAQADGWQHVAERDGVVVESRTLEGCPIREVRVTTRSPLPPGAIMGTLWKHAEYVDFIPFLKRLDVLRNEGDAKLIYEQIRLPFVKDRDVTLRVTRSFSPETGYEMTSVSVPDGPPESTDYVRVPTMESRWRLVPDAEGTAISYTIRTDPGGWVPAWVINHVEKDAPAKLVRAMLDRALQNNR